MTLYFHFTLGPVQGFVAEARRTRDFWAGSFLLSYLAGIAMLEVTKQHGKIIFPKPDETYLTWIEKGGVPGQEPPRQGGIPNRFMAEVDESFQPSKVEQAVQTAWSAIAEAVWNKDLGKDSLKTPTRLLWDRQIKGFWDMAWAIVREATDTGILDRRKNWRSHYLQPEPGSKCMMMEGLQELSGAERTAEGKAFWAQLRKKTGDLELRDNERLCAIAYVKRRLTQGFKPGFKVDMPSGWTAHGWTLPANVPAVTYLAAAPFLVEALQRNPEGVNRFYQVARTIASPSEAQSNIQCIRELDTEHRCTTLDGHVFFEAELRNGKVYPAEKAQPVLQALTTLIHTSKPPLPLPSPYYALLLMDGDSLGQQMSFPAKRELISDALNDFTGSVQAIVEQEYSGFLVYAGGDDVLALLTLDDALPCADALQQRYKQAFETRFQQTPGERFPATLSGAIEYAHYRLPFTKILADAHDLLDEKAKDGCGRDAVAARVWKQSGLHLTYAQPWQTALQADKGLPDLVTLLRQDQASSDTPVAGSFFYRLRELFELLNPGDGEKAVEAEAFAKLLRYEYTHSGLHGVRPATESVEKLVGILLAQCRRQYHDAERHLQTDSSYSADAGLLARFLANRGNERY